MDTAAFDNAVCMDFSSFQASLSAIYGSDAFMRYGRVLVRAMVARYARRVRFVSSPEDERLEAYLEDWLTKGEELYQSGCKIPLMDLMQQDGLIPSEIYAILVVYVYHVDWVFRDAIMHTYQRNRADGIMADMVLGLIDAGDAFKTGLGLKGLNDICHLFENEKYFQRREYHQKHGKREVELYLSEELMHRLDPFSDTSSIANPFVCVESISEEQYVVSNDHKAFLSMFQPGRIRSGLRVLVSGAIGSGRRAMIREIARRMKVRLLRFDVFKCLEHHVSLSSILDGIDCRRSIVYIHHVHAIVRMSARVHEVLEVLKEYRGILFCTTDETSHRDESLNAIFHMVLSCTKPDASVRKEIWLNHIGNFVDAEGISRLTTDFPFYPAQIMLALEQARLFCNLQNKDDPDYEDLNRSCQFLMRRGFGDLTVRTASEAARLERLILPQKQLEMFQAILDAARLSSVVMGDWGFAEHYHTGKGMCVLFDGPPGTGKTFAVDVMGHVLNRPVERVDIPSVVSKWVGETGANIARIFAAAATHQSILLLDEADALVGKRAGNTERATDRYANMEINIILQEIERYNGIVVMTTNLASTMDEALERRIQYRITFNEPGFDERIRLWQSHIPPKALVSENLQFEKLAQLELSGGYIKNAVLAAAYRAASEKRAITHADLWDAGAAECRKLGRLVREAQTLRR